MIDVTLIRMMGAHAVTMSRAILHLFSRHWNFKCLTSARAEGLGNCAFLHGQQSLDREQFLFKSQFPKLMRIVLKVICTSQRNLNVGLLSFPVTATIRSSKMFEKHLQRSRKTGAICCRRNPGSVQCSTSISGRSDSRAKSCGLFDRSDKQNFLAPSNWDKN